MADNTQQAESGEYIGPMRTSGPGQARDVAQSFWQTAYLREKVVIVLGILYALSPIDLIPEVILGPLGLLDDGGAIVVVLLTVVAVLKRLKSSREQAELPEK